MGKLQRVSSKELKEEAVRLVQTSGKPLAQIARELGISDSAIHGWRRELAQHGDEALTEIESGKKNEQPQVNVSPGYVLQATRRAGLST